MPLINQCPYCLETAISISDQALQNLQAIHNLQALHLTSLPDVAQLLDGIASELRALARALRGEVPDGPAA